MRFGARLAMTAVVGMAAIGGWIGETGALAQTSTPLPAPAQDVGQLLEQVQGAAPAAGSVSVSAHVEAGAAGQREVVITLAPEGAAKLIADPGITVQPVARLGVAWVVPLPHRHIDPAIEYFTPPAEVRLPFAADDELPIELRVEYAWCLVEYQCFFGEEDLRVVNRIE